MSCIIPKADKATLAKIQKAIEAAKEDAKGKKWGGKIPPSLKLPLRDGDIDRPDDENYADCMFLNATSKDAPQIVDRKVQPILDPMDCGSGDYANVSVNFYGFSASGSSRSVRTSSVRRVPCGSFFPIAFAFRGFSETILSEFSDSGTGQLLIFGSSGSSA